MCSIRAEVFGLQDIQELGLRHDPSKPSLPRDPPARDNLAILVERGREVAIRHTLLDRARDAGTVLFLQCLIGRAATADAVMDLVTAIQRCAPSCRTVRQPRGGQRTGFQMNPRLAD
jgi:hypothetical protein